MHPDHPGSRAPEVPMDAGGGGVNEFGRISIEFEIEDYFQKFFSYSVFFNDFLKIFLSIFGDIRFCSTIFAKFD